MNLVLNDAEEFLPAPQTQEEAEERAHRDQFAPVSQRSEVDGPGWAKFAKDGNRAAQGRILGWVLIAEEDAVQIELIDGPEGGSCETGDHSGGIL